MWRSSHNTRPPVNCETGPRVRRQYHKGAASKTQSTGMTGREMTERYNRSKVTENKPGHAYLEVSVLAWPKGRIHLSRTCQEHVEVVYWRRKKLFFISYLFWNTKSTCSFVLTGGMKLISLHVHVQKHIFKVSVYYVGHLVFDRVHETARETEMKTLFCLLIEKEGCGCSEEALVLLCWLNSYMQTSVSHVSRHCWSTSILQIQGPQLQ